MIWWMLGALAWLAIGVFNYGATFAYFQRQFPTLAEMDRRSDQRFALLVAACGPIGLPSVFIGARPWRRHGLLWR